MNKDWYYPFCGYRPGFCLKGSPCELPYPPYYYEFDCEFWVEKHPITNQESSYLPEGFLEWWEQEVEALIVEEENIDTD